MKKLKCLSFDLQNWGEQKCGRWHKRSISTVTPLNEHKWPAGTSISQRTVPREHIDTSLIQLMFIFLDTCFPSFFENGALIKNTRKRKNNRLNTVSL